MLPVSMERTGVVAIVGRPNVGKSALFNRLVGRPVAIVNDEPGVTRDRHTQRVEFGGRSFWLVDTGGFDPAGMETRTPKTIKDQMHAQVRLAVEQADVVVFLADVQAGLTAGDRDAANLLRRSGKDVILAVNKVDNLASEDSVHEFFGLGFGEAIPVSALHGRGADDVLDAVVERLPQTQVPQLQQGELAVALVGRPNVGKSSLTNRLLGKEAMVVDPTPGTTRDAVDTPLNALGRKITLIDTAGLRQKNRISEAVERYASMRSLRAIERCDVAVLVLDASDELNEQDERVAGLIHEAGRACVICVNKWDTVAKDNKTFDAFTDDIRAKLPFLDYAPLVFVSAKSKQRLGQLLEMIIRVGDRHAIRITTGELNRALETILLEAPPPTRHGKALKIFYLAQTGVKPPAFALFVNEPKLLHFSYMRRLKHKLRERFDLEGSPLFVMLRRRK
jgi:GTP-binding protein